MLLLVSDSGHRENWSPWNQKLILCLHPSWQALPKPWLWACTAKGTVPSDGLTAVRSDAHNRGCGQASALKFWSPEDHRTLSRDTFHVSILIRSVPFRILLQPRQPLLVLFGSWQILMEVTCFLYLAAHRTPPSFFPGTSLMWRWDTTVQPASHMPCGTGSAGKTMTEGPPLINGREKLIDKNILPSDSEFSIQDHFLMLLLWAHITHSSGQFLSMSPYCLSLQRCFTSSGLCPVPSSPNKLPVQNCLCFSLFPGKLKNYQE